MGQARVIVTFILCAMLSSKTGDAKTYIVGDDKGCTFGVSNWTEGKTFAAGDVLVFQYDPKKHDVVEADEHQYNQCNMPYAEVVHKTGNDKIVLKPGKNFFICGVLGHCAEGMKIAANVPS